MKLSTLARHPLAIAGAVVTTASAVVFVTLVIAMLAGMFSNPYAGLVVFIGIPAVFAVGLLLIPAGMSLERRKLLRDPSASSEWPVIDFRRADVRRTTLLIAGLTGVNIVIILLAGYGACTRWKRQASVDKRATRRCIPSSRPGRARRIRGVACVECHIGEGAGGIRAREALRRAPTRDGRHQLRIRSRFRLAPRCLRAPRRRRARVATSPDASIGDRIRVIREYADDEANTETMTVLQMLMGVTTASARAIHWHADPAVHVEYVATDAERQTIPYVRVTDAKGQVKEYVATDTTEEAFTTADRRTMDCMDCHNTVGHPISPTPEQAVDQAIAAAMVSHDLPFAGARASGS